MRSEVRRGSSGPYLDLSPLFPEGVYAFVTLAGWDTSPEGLLDFLKERGRVCRKVHRVEQIHSGLVVDAAEAPCEADALVCSVPGEAVRVVTADCVPVLLASGDGARVAAVHAGWKGTLARIAETAAGRIVQDGNGAAYVGPAVGPCCYGVDRDRYEAFRGAFPEVVPEAGERPSLDLPAINAAQLGAAGLPPGRIHVEAVCTACSVGLCCSYRRDGHRAGRMAALVGRDG